MTDQTLSIKDLRDRLDNMEFQAGNLWLFGGDLIGRIEAAESENKELKARRHRDMNRIYELETNMRGMSINTDIGMF